PVLDIVEVIFRAHAYLLLGIGLPAPAVDLSPAGNAGLHPVAGEIAVDHLEIESVVGLGGRGVRARTDERELAAQGIEELRQLIDRRLADDAADARHTRIVLHHGLPGRRIALVGIHRAELED